LQTQYPLSITSLGKKGYLSILRHVGSKGQLHYSELQKTAQSSKVIKSSSQLNGALRMLVDYKLPEQKVDASQRME